MSDARPSPTLAERIILAGARAAEPRLCWLEHCLCTVELRDAAIGKQRQALLAELDEMIKWSTPETCFWLSVLKSQIEASER